MKTDSPYAAKSYLRYDGHIQFNHEISLNNYLLLLYNLGILKYIFTVFKSHDAFVTNMYSLYQENNNLSDTVDATCLGYIKLKEPL